MKKTISIILATVMLLGALYIAPVYASTPKEFKDEAFTVLSPKMNGKYTYGESNPLRIRIEKFYYDCTDSSGTQNYIYGYFNNEKDNKILAHYFASDVGKVYDTGYNFRWWEPGVHKIKFEFYKRGVVGSYKFTVVKAKNPITVKSASKSLTAKAMKKAKKTVKPLTIKKAKGTIKVVKVKKGTSAKIYKKISVNKKNDAVTFKKGTYKKGTYKVKLKIKAAGNKNYKSKSITKTVKIKVK